jgi:competence protein ComEA
MLATQVASVETVVPRPVDPDCEAVAGPTVATPTASTASEAAPAGLRRGDQLFAGVMLALTLALLVAHWGRFSGWGRESIEIGQLQARTYTYQFDINQATWVEWLQLEGIGETLARRIVADREENGPFRSIDDLRRVKGIGPKILERMRPSLTVQP